MANNAAPHGHPKWFLNWLYRRRDREAYHAYRAENWKPEYDALADYNRDVSYGRAHDPAYATRMAEVQRDYDENYLGGLAV